MSEPAKCYKCPHHKTIPGDAHLECDHPIAKAVGPDTLIAFGTGIATGFNIKLNSPDGPLEISVYGDEHGIREGWFVWPIDFDPVWLKSCNLTDIDKYYVDPATAPATSNPPTKE